MLLAAMSYKNCNDQLQTARRWLSGLAFIGDKETGLRANLNHGFQSTKFQAPSAKFQTSSNAMA